MKCEGLQARAHQGFCQARKQRSGWGMSARWRPHGDVSAAMPSGEPFGLNGYASVDAPSASQYLRSGSQACMSRQPDGPKLPSSRDHSARCPHHDHCPVPAGSAKTQTAVAMAHTVKMRC